MLFRSGSRQFGNPTIFKATAGSPPIAHTSLSELAAAICPNIYGSSTIGVKKSTVCIIAISSVTLYIAASSDVSIPTIRFLSSNFGNLPRTWARVSGPILAAHPAVFVKLVSFTSDFILVFSSPWY